MHCIEENKDDTSARGTPASTRATPWAGIALLCAMVLPAGWIAGCATREPAPACLLYTSDAADE